MIGRLRGRPPLIARVMGPAQRPGVGVQRVGVTIIGLEIDGLFHPTALLGRHWIIRNARADGIDRVAPHLPNPQHPLGGVNRSA